MTNLKRKIRMNQLGIYVASGLLAIVIALLLERSGLDRFSNDFLTILQVVIVFMIQEFILNKWLDQKKRQAHRPELLRAFVFLKDKFSLYNEHIDAVCKQAGIKREDIFYELGRLYDKLSIPDKPTKPGTI